MNPVFVVQDSYESRDGSSSWDVVKVAEFDDRDTAVAFARRYAHEHRPPKPRGRVWHYRLVEVKRVVAGVGVCIWRRRYPQG